MKVMAAVILLAIMRKYGAKATKEIIIKKTSNLFETSEL